MQKFSDDIGEIMLGWALEVAIVIAVVLVFASS